MKSFIKNKENFICENCGHETKGNGYTNHCPKCLWSRHVDNNPGDRLCDCLGMMKPERVFYFSSRWHISHRCEKCGLTKNIKADVADDLKIILEISKKNQKDLLF